MVNHTIVADVDFQVLVVIRWVEYFASVMAKALEDVRLRRLVIDVEIRRRRGYRFQFPAADQTWRYHAIRTGFEPVIPTLTGWCVEPDYANGPW